ncbi:MAG TPA: Arm DNA-binding domain-containing protein, partial [Mesorhizobium sp.]
MAGRSIHKLSDLTVRTQKVRGRYSDGGGLYLNVGPSGGKSWVFMWTPKGSKRKEMGLGPYPATSLAIARTLAQGCREVVAQGRDPLEERKAEKTPEKPKTFGE